MSARAVILAAAVAVAFLAGGAGAWKVQAWRYGATLAERDKAAAESLAAAHRRSDEVARRAADADAAAVAELEESRHEVEDLRAAVAAGEQRLLVHATCAARVPDSTAAGGLVDEPTCRLSPDAEQAYFALRDGINLLRAQLQACQAYAREVSRPAPE